MQKHLEPKKLQSVYANDEIARALLDYLAEVKRAPNAVSAEVLVQVAGKRGVTVTYDQAVATLRSLGDVGAGQFMVGRRGHVTRLRFHLSPRAVGECARGRATFPQATDVPAAAPEVVEAPAPSFDLSTLRTMPEDELRRVIACATKVLELADLERGRAPVAAVMNGGYGRRRIDARPNEQLTA